MKKRITLIESDEKEPEIKIKLEAGKSIEMVEIIGVDTEGQPKAGRAALCGYGNACLALISVDEE